MWMVTTVVYLWGRFRRCRPQRRKMMAGDEVETTEILLVFSHKIGWSPDWNWFWINPFPNGLEIQGTAGRRMAPLFRTLKSVRVPRRNHGWRWEWQLRVLEYSVVRNKVKAVIRDWWLLLFPQETIIDTSTSYKYWTQQKTLRKSSNTMLLSSLLEPVKALLPDWPDW